MTVNYYLYGRDESEDIDYFIYLGPNIDISRVSECKKWIERFREWWGEDGIIPNKLPLSNLPIEVLEFIVLFKRLTDACGDYKHFLISAVLQWYVATIVDEDAVKKIPEDVRTAVVLEPDLSIVEIKENPNYKKESQ